MNIYKLVIKPRKDYICHDCGINISKNTMHISHTSVADGSFFNTRSHTECYHMWLKLNIDNKSPEDDSIPLKDLLDYEGISFRDWKTYIMEKYQ